MPYNISATRHTRHTRIDMMGENGKLDIRVCAKTRTPSLAHLTHDNDGTTIHLHVRPVNRDAAPNGTIYCYMLFASWRSA